MRDRVAGELQRDEDGRDGVGEDQYTVLGDLGVGDTLHATEHRVEEHDDHAGEQPGLEARLQEAGEGHAYTLHLTDYVGQGGGDQADNRHDAGSLGVVTVTDELGHRELSKLTQVGCQQHGQQHVATGPAHQEDGGVVALEGDQAGHGDEGGGRHPVCGGCHTVGHGMDATACGVELTGSGRLGPDGDADVEGESYAHYDICCCLKIHCLFPLVFVYVEFAVQTVHLCRIDEDLRDEHEHGTLLCKPETEIGTTDCDSR